MRWIAYIFYISIVAITSGCVKLLNSPEQEAVSSEQISYPPSPLPLTKPIQVHIFNPEKLEVGDNIAGLELVAIQFSSSQFPSPSNHQQHIPVRYDVDAQFRGEITVRGQYRFRKLFEVEIEATPCFYVDEIDNNQLPRVVGDERIPWFCFENREEAILAFGGEAIEQAVATITVDNFQINFVPKAVHNKANLVRVLETNSTY